MDDKQLAARLRAAVRQWLTTEADDANHEVELDEALMSEIRDVAEQLEAR